MKGVLAVHGEKGHIERNPAVTHSPIFILGIMHRSGTNFFRDLLLLHPHCKPGLPAEDFLVAYSDLLVLYAKSISKEWNAPWRVKQYLHDPEREIMKHIGEGLISFLNLIIPEEVANGDRKISAQHPRQRLVTKTPSIRNLQNFFTVFPNAQLIILIRDGRSVVESGMQSFQWKLEAGIRTWADAARTILEFARQTPDTDGRYLIARYEDVFLEPEKQMRRILSFLGLEIDCYDFEKAANLPVRGSSEEQRKSQRHQHWKPVKKTPDFNPLTRWNYWGKARHQRFNWIAGKYLVHFGYCRAVETKVPVLWQIWNVTVDVKHAIRRVWVRLKQLRRKRLTAQE